MGRLPRPTVDGLIFHAINRGNNRADVYFDDSDRQAFLDAIANTKERYPFRLFGYCLMPNHFHLLLRPNRGQSLSRIMQSLTVAHTWRHHKRWKSDGHVWQGRFKSPVIQDGAHVLTVLRYIESNPLRTASGPASRLVPLVEFPRMLDGSQTRFSTRSRSTRRWVALRRSGGRVGSARLSGRFAKKSSRGSANRPTAAVRWASPNGSPRKPSRLGIELNPRPRGRPRKSET